MKRIVILLAMFVTACSASDRYYLENYGSDKPHLVTVGGEEFAIVDVARNNRILVQHARRRNWSCAADPQYELAAVTFLKSSGRSCTINNAQCVPTNGIEYFYTCKP